MSARFEMFENEIAARFAKRFANTAMVIDQSPLPKSTQELVALRTSQINGCGFCVDMHSKDAAAAGETPVRLADHHRGVGDETWAQVREHYDDDQVAALIALVALVNAANRMNVIVRNPAGSYRPGMFDAMTSAGM
jgi:AhpD family alkylhydroperoxidase